VIHSLFVGLGVFALVGVFVLVWLGLLAHVLLCGRSEENERVAE